MTTLARREQARREQPYGGAPCQGGRCKPSFLIVGIGKCGTSSLYYYLAGHPSVVEASQKQIQWFDHQYDRRRFQESYLRHFRNDLRSGELTGEASPGYAAYGAVPGRVHLHLPGVRILCTVRDPAERAYSAYYYNYLAAVRNKDLALDFFDLVHSEIEFLRTHCGITENSSHLDLSADCYGKTDAQTQTGAVAAKKFPGSSGLQSLPRANQHLWRQLVGRSLYALYLEAWYRVFPAEDIFVVCSERLGEPTSAVAELSAVSAFLGLPDFDFAAVVAAGKYNAGNRGKAGYRSITAWDQLPKRPPMPDDARRLVDDFAKPFSDRLFTNLATTTPRCPNWALSLPPRPAAHEEEEEDSEAAREDILLASVLSSSSSHKDGRSSSSSSSSRRKSKKEDPAAAVEDYFRISQLLL